MSNYRLELAFLIPDDRKLTVTEVQATVMQAIDAIDATSLNQMKKGAVRFNSMDELMEYGAELQIFKRQWNKKFLAKQRAIRKGGDQKNGTNS